MSTTEHDIPASFTWSAQDYMAFVRGVGMLRNKSYDSWAMRVGFLLFGHLFLVTGFFSTAVAISGARRGNGPIPMNVLVTGIFLSLVAAYFLFTKWYGWRWMMERAFRSSQLSDLKVSYLFRPTQIELTSRLAQSRRVWSVITQIVEFRDAFILVSGGSAEWLPRYAFAEPFDDARFVELARNSVRIYKFIDRNTFMDQKPVHGMGLSSDEPPPAD